MSLTKLRTTHMPPKTIICAKIIMYSNLRTQSSLTIILPPFVAAILNAIDSLPILLLGCTYKMLSFSLSRSLLTNTHSSSCSPILFVAEYRLEDYIDGTRVPVCLTQASDPWTMTFFIMIISGFFLLPLLILVVLYTIIAKNLVYKDGVMFKIRPSKPEQSLKARKQVVFMLGAVVLSFFLCLLPFRILTLWIILAPDEKMNAVGMEKYYTILYFCRVMLYLNSAINPILYNLMSSKFRKGFKKVYCCFFCPANGRLTPEQQRAAAAAAAAACLNNTTSTTTTTSFLTHSTSSWMTASGHHKSYAATQQKTVSLDDLRMNGKLLSPNGGGSKLQVENDSKWSLESVPRRGGAVMDSNDELRKMAMRNMADHQRDNCSGCQTDYGAGGGGCGEIRQIERLIRTGKPFRQTSYDESFFINKGQRRKLLFQYSLE